MPIHENDTDSVVFLYSLEDSFFYAHVDSHVKPKKYPTNLEPHSFFYSTCSSLHYTASFFFSLTNKIIQVVLASLPIHLYYQIKIMYLFIFGGITWLHLHTRPLDMVKYNAFVIFFFTNFFLIIIFFFDQFLIIILKSSFWHQKVSILKGREQLAHQILWINSLI
jgi:hypothetical protein